MVTDITVGKRDYKIISGTLFCVVDNEWFCRHKQYQ